MAGYSFQNSEMREVILIRADEIPIGKKVAAEPCEAGLRAGERGDDPRCCPYQKMTREWNEWQRWHAIGIELGALGNKQGN